jgi:hypothetical protein
MRRLLMDLFEAAKPEAIEETAETSPAAIGESPLSPEAHSWRWLLHFSDREPVEVRILPEQTHAEVLASHPDAIAAEPLPDLESAPQPLPEELDALISRVAGHHGFTAEELSEALTGLTSRDVPGALVSFRLLDAEINQSVVDQSEIDRDAFEERAGILEFDGGYPREDAEMLAAWELTQALFARLTAREWLARYAPDRLPAGDKVEDYPIAQAKPGNDFWRERERRGTRR